MTYLGWFQPDKKLTVDQKLANAVARYREKFGEEPDTVLVSPLTFLALNISANDRLAIHARGYIAPDTFYIGKGDQP